MEFIIRALIFEMIVGRTFRVIDMRIKNLLSHNFADLYHEIRAAGGIILTMYWTVYLSMSSR